MIFATVTGNIGQDAELRRAGANPVCSFTVASNRKVKGEDVTTWVRASVWGKRGESLVVYLTKGTKVTLVGELSTREHNGKTYLELRVSELDFAGGKRSESRQQRSEPVGSGAEAHGFDDAPLDTPDGDDGIPF